jgi:hypothetical protein
MPFPQDPKTFTLYNYGTGTATVSSLVFATADGTQHRADPSGFGASTTYTNPTLTGLAVSLAPAASIPFTLDYTNSSGELTSYRNILTINGTVNGFSDQASLDADVVVSSAPVVDGGGGGGEGGNAPGPCGDDGVSASCSASGGAGGSSGGCVIATSLTNLGTWSMTEKLELIRWCEQSLHNTVLGEAFRRGYQVLGSRFILPVLFKNGTGFASKYVEWSFNNATSMLRGNQYNKLSIPNSIVWLTAMTLTGVVVSKRYARKSWISLYRKAK